MRQAQLLSIPLIADECAHQLARIADSWSKKIGFEAGIDDPELKKAFIKARKQARRETYVLP